MNKYFDKDGLKIFLKELAAKWVKFDDNETGLGASTVQGALTSMYGLIPKVNLEMRQVVLSGIQVCWGRELIECEPDTIVSKTVQFPSAFADATELAFLVTPRTAVPGDIVQGVSGYGSTEEGTIHVLRSNDTSTVVTWFAIGSIASQ